MPGDLVFALAGVFIGTALLAGVLASSALSRIAPARRRLESLAVAVPAAGALAPEVRLVDRPAGIAARLGTVIPRSPKDAGHLTRRLGRAGFHGAVPLAVYTLSELIAPVLFGGLVLLVWGLAGRALFFAALAALVGYMLPGLVLQRFIVVRQKQIRNGLADGVDLLIVCVEAGSSLDQAVVKASEELRISYPALAQELQYVNTEVRAGKPRLEAFRNFAERTKVDDVRALVSMMVQTDRFGTSIAQALRTFADAMRVKRRQDAEERAGKLGVKLVFPLVFCLFPALFVVLLGPAAITIFRVLISQVGR